MLKCWYCDGNKYVEAGKCLECDATGEVEEDNNPMNDIAKWKEEAKERREKLKQKISGIISYGYLGTDEGSLLSDDLAEKILKVVEDSEEPEYYNKVMEMREEEER